MKTKPPLHKVKQLIITDSLESANVLISSPDWILIDTYKRYRGQFYYVIGRIADFEEEENESNLEEFYDLKS